MITWAVVTLLKAALKDSRHPISGDLGCLLIITAAADIVICIAAAVAVVAIAK